MTLFDIAHTHTSQLKITIDSNLEHRGEECFWESNWFSMWNVGPIYHNMYWMKEITTSTQDVLFYIKNCVSQIQNIM